jgi:SAM-dependent methyltransferase
MALDIVDLRGFYASGLGAVVRRLILAAVQARWENVSGLAIMGLGYATPYLGPFREKAARTIAFMPGGQGVVNWPSTGLSASALVDPVELPLREGSLDRIILAHALEVAHNPGELMAELWRVLSPGGRVIVIAPNRAGLWARFDWTPFGQGQPFSRSQVSALMRQAQFTPVHWGEALYVPPVSSRLLVKSAVSIDRVCARLNLPFAGVHVIEATKQVWRPLPVRKAFRLAPVPEPVMVPSTRVSDA